MLHIILFILKVIGIILASILGILLFLILVVLLVPIRYQMKGNKTEEISAEAKVSWLFRLLCLRITYLDSRFVLTFKILGKVFYDSDKPKRVVLRKVKRFAKKIEEEVKGEVEEQIEEQAEEKLGKPVEENVNKKVKEKMNDKSDNKSEDKSTNNKIQKTDESNKANEPNKIESDSIPLIKVEDKNITKKDTNLPDGSAVETNNEDKKSKKASKSSKNTFGSRIKKIPEMIMNLVEKIKNIWQSIKKAVINIFYKIRNVKNKILGFFDLLSRIKEFYNVETNKKGIHRILLSIKKALRHIRPTKFMADLEFGTGDPCTTGQALGAFSILYGYYGKNVRIIPNFDQAIIEGNLFLQGRIRLFTILIICIKLILNKNFRILIKNFRDFKEEL